MGKTAKEKPRKKKAAKAEHVEGYTARRHPIYGQPEGTDVVHMFRGTPMSQALCHGTDTKKFFDAKKVEKRPISGVRLDEVCTECLVVWYGGEKKGSPSPQSPPTGGGEEKDCPAGPG